MNIAYQDISHFRAPYKNSVFGAAEEPQPLEVAALEVMDKRDGAWYWKTDAANGILKMLEHHAVIFITNSRVAIRPFSDEEWAIVQSKGPGFEILQSLSARQWVTDRLADGDAVFAPIWVGQMDALNRELASIPSKDKAAVKTAASLPVVGVLAEPGGTKIAGFKLSTLAIGAVGIGAAWYFLK